MAPALTNEEKENRRLRVQQNVLYRQSLLEQADRIECERGAMRRRERTLRHHDQLRREEREARSLEVQEQGDSRSGHTSHRHLSRRSAAAMRGAYTNVGGGGSGGGGGGIDLHRVVSTVADGALDMRLMSRNAAAHQELLAVDVMRRIRAADKQSRGRASRRHPTLASNATRTSTDRADTTASMTSSPPPPPPPATPQRRLRTERVARRSRQRTCTTSGVASRTRQASARNRLSANGHQTSHRATVARPRAPSPTTKYFGGTVHSRTRARTRRRGRRSCSKQSTDEAWKRQKSKSTTSKNSDRSKGPR